MLKTCVLVIILMMLACGLGYAEYDQTIDDGMPTYYRAPVMGNYSTTIRVTAPERIIMDDQAKPIMPTNDPVAAPVVVPQAPAQAPNYSITSAAQVPNQPINNNIARPTHSATSTISKPVDNNLPTTRNAGATPIRVERQYIPRK